MIIYSSSENKATHCLCSGINLFDRKSMSKISDICKVLHEYCLDLTL